VTTRTAFLANMVVLRDLGEVFLRGTAVGRTTSRVERIDPDAAPLARSDNLPYGPFWRAASAHANGDLDAGAPCHRLDAVRCGRAASCRARQPNTCWRSDDLVMKNSCATAAALVLLRWSRSGWSGVRGVRSRGLDRAHLEGHPTAASSSTSPATHALPLSIRARCWSATATGRVAPHMPDGEQSYAWIRSSRAAARGSSTTARTTHRSLKGTGVATGPVHLHRVSTSEAGDTDVLTPFDCRTACRQPAADRRGACIGVA
jgi:hypothetical protein